MDILYESNSQSKKKSSYSPCLKKIHSKKYRINLRDMKFRKKIIEIKLVFQRSNINNNVIYNEKKGHLNQEKSTRTEWIDSFFFIKFHELQSNLLLISFIFFLKRFYFWLDSLHLSLRHEHLMLRKEKNHSNNHRDTQYRKSKRIPKYMDKIRKQIIHWSIKKSYKYLSQSTTILYFNGLKVFFFSCLELKNILSWI